MHIDPVRGSPIRPRRAIGIGAANGTWRLAPGCGGDTRVRSGGDSGRKRGRRLPDSFNRARGDGLHFAKRAGIQSAATFGDRMLGVAVRAGPAYTWIRSSGSASTQSSRMPARAFRMGLSPKSSDESATSTSREHFVGARMPVGVDVLRLGHVRAAHPLPAQPFGAFGASSARVL